jgi:hypothetical protein
VKITDISRKSKFFIHAAMAAPDVFPWADLGGRAYLPVVKTLDRAGTEPGRRRSVCL